MRWSVATFRTRNHDDSAITLLIAPPSPATAHFPPWTSAFGSVMFAFTSPRALTVPAASPPATRDLSSSHDQSVLILLKPLASICVMLSAAAPPNAENAMSRA